MQTESVEAILNESVRLVRENYPEESAEVRAVLVNHAIRLLAVQQAESPTPNGSLERTAPEQEQDNQLGPYALIAKHFGITTGQASDLFRIEDENIGLSIGHGDIDRSKKKGTEEIALLLCACNQVIHGTDSYLPINTIRREAEELNRYDSPNFSRVFESEYFIDNRKKGSTREMRLKTHGREIACGLVQRIVGAKTANAE